MEHSCDMDGHNWIRHASYRRKNGTMVPRRRCTRCGRTISEATGSPLAGLRKTRATGRITVFEQFWASFNSQLPCVGIPSALDKAVRETGVARSTASRWLAAVADGLRPATGLQREDRAALQIYTGRGGSRQVEGVPEADSFLPLVYAARQMVSVVTGRRFPSWLDRAYPEGSQRGTSTLPESSWAKWRKSFPVDARGEWHLRDFKIERLIISGWEHAPEPKPNWAEWEPLYRYHRSEILAALLYEDLPDDLLISPSPTHRGLGSWNLLELVVPDSELETTYDLIEGRLDELMKWWDEMVIEDDEAEKGLQYTLLGQTAGATVEIRTRRRVVGRATAASCTPATEPGSRWILQVDRRADRPPQLRQKPIPSESRRQVAATSEGGAQDTDLSC
jgi:hypothetical protein